MTCFITNKGDNKVIISLEEMRREKEQLEKNIKTVMKVLDQYKLWLKENNLKESIDNYLDFLDII